MTMFFFNATAEAADALTPNARANSAVPWLGQSRPMRGFQSRPRHGVQKGSISPTPWECSGRGTNLGSFHHHL